jgi:DeoR/GlpR family transcriptional regulator of sugar metabolism
MIRETGGVRVADLVVALEVSDMTVRRDLDALESSGLIVKVHGGATAVGQRASYEPGFKAKITLQQAEKAAIADAAASLIQPGTAIGLGAGTTTFALAQRLIGVPSLTIVTNSVSVADVLHEGGDTDQTVLLTGGRRTPSDALVGPFAVASLRTVHLDQVFLGVHGLDADAGLTTPNIMEAETNRALIDAGGRLIVVADHTKWGAVGMSSMADLDDVDTVITDSGIDVDARATLADRVRELVVVDAYLQLLEARPGLAGL